jgi:hypothetical protein
MYETIHRVMTGQTAEPDIPQWTVEALGGVATGRSELRAVRHPLGFLCLPLERAGERGVCVHVWSDRFASARAITSTTHAHSWDLVSYVLYGTLRNRLVSVTDEPAAPTHRVCEIVSGGDADEIRHTPRLVRSGEGVSEVHRQGDVYRLPAGLFHETLPEGEVATVALGNGRPGAVDLALGDLNTGTHRIRRQLCGLDETAYAATVVVERLAEISEPRSEDPCGCRGR